MIKIIKGVYGHIVNGIVEPKNAKSAPFSLSPEREAELVRSGVAEYAGAEAARAYDSKMKLTELKEIAASHGIDSENAKTKAAVLELLDHYFAEEEPDSDTESGEESESGEEPPSFTAEDSVVE